MSPVELREIDSDNVREVMRLKVTEAQDGYVAPNSWSIAEAAYAEQKWLRAVYANEEPVGLVLLSERRSVPRFYLWRFMIDHRQQGKGYGRAAMDTLVEYVNSIPNATELFLSFVRGPDGPEGFYRSLGFEPTGRIEHGEHEMVLTLVQS